MDFQTYLQELEAYGAAALKANRLEDADSIPVDGTIKLDDYFKACYYLHHNCVLKDVEFFKRNGETKYLITIWGRNIDYLTDQLMSNQPVIDFKQYKKAQAYLSYKFECILKAKNIKRSDL